MKIPRRLLKVAAVLSLAAFAAQLRAQAPASLLAEWAAPASDRPMSLPLRNGIFSHEEPVLPPLSAEQEAALLAAIQRMPAMSPYVLSGCHDRAHALWLMLPAALRAYTAKVWLLAPAVMTLANPAAITLRHPGPQKPSWTYHVALVYRGEGGLMAIDPALKAGNAHHAMAAKDWLGHMHIPPGTIIALLKAELYLFYTPTIKLPVSLNSSTAIVSDGQFFIYEGESRNLGYIENALARDDVARELNDHPEHACPELRDLLEKPGDLLTRLQGKVYTEHAVLLQGYFKSRAAFWRQKIDAGP